MIMMMMTVLSSIRVIGVWSNWIIVIGNWYRYTYNKDGTHDQNNKSKTKSYYLAVFGATEWTLAPYRAAHFFKSILNQLICVGFI